MGLRGPAPKSRDKKILEGTFRRDRDTGPTFSPAPLAKRPGAPAYLTPVGKKEWKRIVGELMAANALTGVDLTTLEGYCAAYARAMKIEAQQAKLTDLDKDDIATATKAWASLLAFATKLGITPADHTRVKVTEQKPQATKDPWEGVANG